MLCDGNDGSDPPRWPKPPQTRTRPSDSSVAVCNERALLIAPVSVQVSAAGSYSSADASASPGAPVPPATSTLPSGSVVAVWPSRATRIAARGAHVVATVS